jgi:hypothetical protein
LSLELGGEAKKTDFFCRAVAIGQPEHQTFREFIAEFQETSTRNSGVHYWKALHLGGGP